MHEYWTENGEELPTCFSNPLFSRITNSINKISYSTTWTVLGSLVGLPAQNYTKGTSSQGNNNEDLVTSYNILYVVHANIWGMAELEPENFQGPSLLPC